MSAWYSIFDEADVRRLEPGHVLFVRGEPVRSVFLVRSGTIALDRPLEDGTALTLHLATAGYLVAEASLFADVYHCDGIAREAVEVAKISKPSFLSALRGSPEAAMDLLQASSREVQAQRARVEILRLRRVADRLDAWLELYGEPQRGGWVEVAEAIGVTPPALYRELARRRDGPRRERRA